MTKVNFINHSSILIENEEAIVLTDPWYDNPAFGTWLPTPPTLYHPVYLLSLAESNKDKFILVISHGHDDHCDDDYLKLFPNETKVVIPKFSSPGLVKRLQRAGFSNIIEVSQQEVVNNITFNTFIYKDISHDDAIISIKTNDSYIIHSNDNWRFTDDHISQMKNESDGLDILLATQINIANGWPYLYEEYTKEEKLKLANERLIHIMNEVYKSAIKIGVNYFFHYAGHSKAYVKDNPELLELGGFKPLDFYKKNINPDLFKQIKFLDMLAGYSFNFKTKEVTSPFSHFTYNETSLKDVSDKFYNNYDILKSTDSYIYSETELPNETREKLLEKFLLSFNDYVKAAIERSGNYQKEIINSVISIETNKITKTLKVGTGLVNDKGVQPNTTFIMPNPILDAVLNKKIIWENLEIGLQCKIKKDKEYHNGHIMRWLAKYGYLYFKTKN